MSGRGDAFFNFWPLESINNKGFIKWYKKILGVKKICREWFPKSFDCKFKVNGLIKRKVYAQVPPKVEYSLTETGLSLKSVLKSMEEWGLKYKEECY